ncbi:MAG TPA: hypothetical protein VNH11_02280, partial [Pirellulales bacterium]|nr:hypothetical protein [Pirellulales bacterium]
LPDQLRLSISGVRPETCQDAARFDGDYILDLVDRDAAVSRWEVQFDPHCRLYRATLSARPRLRELELSAALEGGVPGPRWTGTSSAAIDQPITLRLDGSLAAGCRWPETITLKPIRAAVGPAFQPGAAARYDISAQPTAAERAAMALMAGGSSSSSSSRGCGSH